MHLRHLTAATALAVAALLPSAAPAAASCILDERPMEQKVDEAPVVFVGTVVETRHNDTTARVRVEEVWKGQADLSGVVVQGGTGEDDAATSVDRSFVVGTRYLFFPQPDGNHFLDNSCSPTAEWSADFGAFRPEDARTADGSSDPGGASGQEQGGSLDVASDEGGAGLPFVLAAGVVATAGAAAWVATRRRRPTDA